MYILTVSRPIALLQSRFSKYILVLIYSSLRHVPRPAAVLSLPPSSTGTMKLPANQDCQNKCFGGHKLSSTVIVGGSRAGVLGCVHVTVPTLTPFVTEVATFLSHDVGLWVACDI